MIDNVDGFISALCTFQEMGSTGSLAGNGGGGRLFIIMFKENLFGNMYCPKCYGGRRMTVSLLYSPFMRKGSNGDNVILAVQKSVKDQCIKEMREQLNFSLWIFKCTQCDTVFTVTFYKNTDGISMVILPSCHGGVVTPNTPAPVAYYLDQAYRAKSVGANSACMAMYRGALDQLMHEQGYKSGMLGVKLGELKKDIDAGSAPKWADTLDAGYLECINALGSGSIHPNDGDVEKQKELDNSLLELVDIVFAKLLDIIYEQPKREEERLKLLEDKASILGKIRQLQNK